MIDFSNHDLVLRDSDVEDMRALLRIPSVSADPAYAPRVREAAEWLRDRCTRAGLEHSKIVESAGHPSVYADWLHAPGRPTVLIYAHFDVQPVADPSVWATDPFEPVFSPDRVIARGASDMKSQLLAALLALEDMLGERGALPVNVRVLLEGEEEVLSPNLRGLLTSIRDELACDFAVSPDGQQSLTGRPRIGVGSRGFCDLEVAVDGAQGDLHSGSYGGAIQNPAHALANLISGLHGADGRVAVEGFYDDVVVPSAKERGVFEGELDEIAALGAALGSFGERDWSPWERTTLRPALDVNGLIGGYTGPGPMTLIPARARAKLSCRLVPDQDPDTIRALVGAHLERHAPPGVRVTVTPGRAAAPAYRCPPDHPVVAAASAVLRQLSGGKEPELELSGGSLPVQAFLLAELGSYMIAFGFSCDDDGAHGVDEFHRLASFTDCRAAYRMLLDTIGERGV